MDYNYCQQENQKRKYNDYKHCTQKLSFWKICGSPSRDVFDSLEADGTLQENGVSTSIGWVFQNCQRTELGTAWGHIHLRLGHLETATILIWLEGLGNVSWHSILCQEWKGDSLLEGPGEEWVKLSLHESYEERDMSASTRPISIEIDTQAQLVAMPRGEEWGTVEWDGLPQDSIPPPPGQLRYLPDVHPVVAGSLQGLHRQCQFAVVVLELLHSMLQFGDGILGCSGVQSGSLQGLYVCHSMLKDS